MELLETIKDIRTSKKISQAEMADRLGMAQNNYGKIERGIIEMTVQRLFQIAEILEVSPNRLLGLDTVEFNHIEKEKEIEELKKRVAELERSNNLLEGNSYILEEISKKFIKGLLNVSYKTAINRIPIKIEILDTFPKEISDPLERLKAIKELKRQGRKLLSDILRELSNQGFFKVILRDSLFSDKEKVDSIIKTSYFLAYDYKDEEVLKTIIYKLERIQKNMSSEDIMELFLEDILPIMFEVSS